MKKSILVLGVLAAAGTAMASGTPVQVTATGTVYFNGIGDTALSGVGNGETATMTAWVDAAFYSEDIPGDVRAYNLSSFALDFSGGTSVGLGAGDAYFAMVDGFPVSDGFFVSSGTTSPGGVALDAGDYQFNLDIGYVGTTLGSLDITDAYGTYDFDGLTRFSMNVWRLFPDNVQMGIEFSSLTIVPAPAGVAAFAGLGLVSTRRRR